MPSYPPSAPPDRFENVPARIVVADDDRVGRELLAGMLRKAGHTVEVVSDGQQAVDRVAQGGVDLVLLDVVMPKMSGLEACRILKGIAGDGFIPVVLVTVKTDTASRVDGLKIGADDYVCKPFDEQELLARTGAMLRIKRLHDHIAAERERLAKLSIHDELTGLYNYRYLHTRLEEELRRAERHHEPLACAMIDIDQLKPINEIAGRGVGDEVIRGVASAIRRTVRDIDVVARYGGEEFLVILPNTHFAGSVSAAERIWREAQQIRVEYDGRSISPCVSIGIAFYPSRDVRTKDSLLRGTDAALQQAKREGGNRICIFQQQGLVHSPAPGVGAAATRASSDRTSPDRASLADIRVDDPLTRKP